MADYEIQKDVGKVVDWLSGVKDHAFRGVDNFYRDIKTNAAQEHRPPKKAIEPRPVPQGSTSDGTIGVAVAYGFLLLLVVIFLYRDKDSWLRRRFSLGLAYARRRWQSKSTPPTDF